jgi:hypothetical protein
MQALAVVGTLVIGALGCRHGAGARRRVLVAGRGRAGVAVGVGNVPPVVYAPPPVYVAPQPVYVRPRPVYVAPPPAYYAPPVVYRPAPGYYYARGASTGAADGIAAITTTATGIDCRLRLRVFCSCPLPRPNAPTRRCKCSP